MEEPRFFQYVNVILAFFKDLPRYAVMLFLAVTNIKVYAIKITSNGMKKNPLVMNVKTNSLSQPVHVLITEVRIPNDHDMTMAEYSTTVRERK
jgi:hypothetical protein